MERIEFAEAISDELLLRKAFSTLSVPQQVCLKATYGLPLSKEELVYWSAFNGFGLYDELGYLQGVVEDFPYRGEEMEDITLILGRRSGKSERVSSFIIAYEALCGGHKGFLDNKKQDPVFLQVAQDLATAKQNLRQFILHWLEMSKIGAVELKRGNITADTITLSTGRITVGPPTIKLRGQAIAVAAMDEVAVWPKDQESANPDKEVEVAVRPAMMQFPFRKLIKTSSPMTEEGILWTSWQTGTYGHKLAESTLKESAAKVLVLKAPTASMENPKATKAYLIQERLKDAGAFSREYLAEFAKSVTGFLSPLLLRQSVTDRVRQRAPESGNFYVATMDPAFRRDAFAFAIGHLKEGKFVLDFLDAPRGTKENPLSPEVRMSAIAQVCKRYGVATITTDQYHDVSLQELALSHDLTVEPYYLNAKIKKQVWGEFVAMLNQGCIRLLDDPALLEEMMGMERYLTPNGNVQIMGKRDDSATVVALNLHKCLQYGEREAPKVKQEVPLSTQMRQRVLARNRGSGSTQWWNR